MSTTTTTVTTVHPDGRVETVTTTVTADPPAAAAPAAVADASAEDRVFPDTPAKVTPEFMSKVLGAKVKSVSTEILGIGFICDAHKATLEYEEGSSGPPSVVLKMAKDDAASRAMNAPFFALEAHWYRNIEQHAPLKCVKAFGVFTDSSDPGRFLLVLENLNLVEGNEHNPNWLIGAQRGVIQSIIDDLAKLHGKFFESPKLSTLIPPFPIPGVPEGAFSGPILGYSMAAFAPFPGAAAAGFPEGTPPIDMLEPIVSKMKDYLEWDYTMLGDDTVHRIPGGPMDYPDGRFKLPNGMALVLKASQILGSRPQTLLHGDGHPGNSFVNKATGETTWLDYQCYAKGPPGLDLAQALSLGVLETSKTTLKEMTQAYHKKLCEYGPPGLAEKYTSEMCWEDFMLGMIVFYPTYVMIHCLTLSQLATDENGEMKRIGLKTIVQRYITLLQELDFLEFCDEILKR